MAASTKYGAIPVGAAGEEAEGMGGGVLPVVVVDEDFGTFRPRSKKQGILRGNKVLGTLALVFFLFGVSAIIGLASRASNRRRHAAAAPSGTTLQETSSTAAAPIQPGRHAFRHRMQRKQKAMEQLEEEVPHL